MIRSRIAACTIALLAGGQLGAEETEICQRELVVLGAGQDAGAPQIGNAQDDGPQLLPSSLALIDREAGARYLFDASPAITEQLAALDRIAPPAGGLGLDGIFLTHAHIGHYLGLAYLGREAASAKGVPVYAMPRMAQFLRDNGPWSQLVELGQIEVVTLGDGNGLQAVSLAPDLVVVALPVPHRDEFSETVGYYIMPEGGGGALYLPDIDSWDEWSWPNGPMLATMLARADHIFVDATFWDDNELPGRDMSEIPHPRVTGTMDLLQHYPADVRAKVHFIHYNHTNPLREPDSAESREVEARGFHVARRGDRICLD
ncbi:MBL fold metallo-hydrolase [Qipengyuania xiamenensis]|uniref:MBL fold metallo-hydrolase n=1 Tax=Qipengyuania xiamenensis TaxID=2867237 RepID=UPI0031EC05F2